MVNDNFIFKKGKYAGKSYGLVKKINPSYIVWVNENAPGLLEEYKPTPKPAEPRKEVPEVNENKKSAIQPNLDFFSERSTHQSESKDSTQQQ